MEHNCLACDLLHGEVPLPGGSILRRGGWAVEHCVGPLGVGTLLIKPVRHITSLAQLNADEASTLGALLQQASACVQDLTRASQVYACLWSHAGFQPSHVHFVVQPVAENARVRFEHPGPALQVQMFREGITPDRDKVETFCEDARAWFRAREDAPAST